MYNLTPDEKTTLVMVYTQNALFRGEVVTKNNIRVSGWLRTDGAPNFMHLLKAQALIFGGGPVKPASYPEIFVPTGECIAFHLAPPESDPLDYDEGEANRAMHSASMLVGTFTFKGKLRIYSQSDMGGSLEVARSRWLSVYEVEITNPFLPQMIMQVPMVLLSPNHISFALDE
jgi:hypothetical protein